MAKVGLILRGKPNIKQDLFFRAKARHIGYGGARGGGKSWAMRRKFIMLALAHNNLKILLLRRTMPELRQNHMLPLIEEIGNYAKYKSVENVFVFPNGSRIQLGFCATDADVIQYQGSEYDVIGFEEATNFTEYQKDFISTANRSTRSDFKPRIYYTANPGGVGHQWFKRLFIDRDFRNNENDKDYMFIQADVYDNEVLMKENPEYVTVLENLPEELRRAHLYGDWDAFAGQYFKEFRRDVHVIEPFEIPDDWTKYATLDYGLDMFAVLWIAVDKQDNAYCYRELYEKDLIVSEAAKRFVEYNGTDVLDTIYGPPDLWNRRNDTGQSAFDIFNDNGVYMMKSSNERIDGWYAVKEYLKVIKSKDEQTGKDVETSKVKFFRGCLNIIRTLPQLQFDEKKHNDVAKDPHELTHIPDALRGFCIERQMQKREKSYEEELFESKRKIELTNFAAGTVSESFLEFGG